MQRDAETQRIFTTDDGRSFTASVPASQLEQPAIGLEDSRKDKMKLHKFCKLFPEITGDDFKTLVIDIKANGLRHPITTLDEQILDGQNRWNACIAAGVKPVFEEFKGDDPLAFVIGQNMNRRHLTDDQRAAIAADIAKMKPGQNRVADSATLPPTIAKAAAAMKVTERLVSLAKAVKKESPKAFKQVKSGKLSLNAAHEANHPRKPRGGLFAKLEAERTDRDAAELDRRLKEAILPNPVLLDKIPTAAPAPVVPVAPVDAPLTAAAAISTVADALAYCRTTEEPGGNWETAAMMLAPEVERLQNLLRSAQSKLEEITNEACNKALNGDGPLTPDQLLRELRKFAPRIPDTLAQSEREKYGHKVNEMVKWLMNPVKTKLYGAYIDCAK